jgi:hypothetical protein
LLGPYGLLPLLKGWEYKTHNSGLRTVTKGAPDLEVVRASNELGWLQFIGQVSTDCYVGMELTYQGGNLQPQTSRGTIESAYITGAFGIGADPAGFVQLYYRPVPTSTFGAYTLISNDLYYGDPLPYLPTVIVSLYLDTLSTQNTAETQFVANVLQITNRQEFIRSLRKVLGTKNMVIDPALMQYGTVLLNHLKGEEWKVEVKQ